jgi:RNA-binding protein YhbY
VTSPPSAISAVRAIASKISTRELIRVGAARNEREAALLIAQALDAADHLERLTAPPIRGDD